jgi:hypothetical protein
MIAIAAKGASAHRNPASASNLKTVFPLRFNLPYFEGESQSALDSWPMQAYHEVKFHVYVGHDKISTLYTHCKFIF